MLIVLTQKINGIQKAEAIFNGIKIGICNKKYIEEIENLRVYKRATTCIAVLDECYSKSGKLLIAGNG